MPDPLSRATQSQTGPELTTSPFTAVAVARGMRSPLHDSSSLPKHYGIKASSPTLGPLTSPLRAHLPWSCLGHVLLSLLPGLPAPQLPGPHHVTWPLVPSEPLLPNAQPLPLLSFHSGLTPTHFLPSANGPWVPGSLYSSVSVCLSCRFSRFAGVPGPTGRPPTLQI